MKEIFHSFDYWSKNGYKIKAGAKSSRRNTKGIPLFSDKQITKNKQLGLFEPRRNGFGFDDQEFDNGCYGGDPMDYGDS